MVQGRPDRGEAERRLRGEAERRLRRPHRRRSALARGLIVCHTIFDHTSSVVLLVPSDCWLRVGRLRHAAEEAEVVKEGNELVRLLVLQLVAARVGSASGSSAASAVSINVGSGGCGGLWTLAADGLDFAQLGWGGGLAIIRPVLIQQYNTIRIIQQYSKIRRVLSYPVLNSVGLF